MNDQAGGGQETGWKFQATDQPGQGQSSRKPSQPVKWTASEFIEHEKAAGWYIILLGSAASVATLFYVLTKDVITMVMIVVAAMAFGVLAARKPRVLDYQVDDSGVTVGPKFYPYANFKSFAIINEGAVNSIWLMPLKRFMPILTVYFAPEDGDKIVKMIGDYLPVQNHELDPVDRFVQKIRF